MIGKKIRVRNFKSDAGYESYIKIYDNSENVITTALSHKYNTWIDSTFVVPEDTAYIKFYSNGGWTDVYEVQLVID